MSVLKNLQALSDLEFYRCAVKLQDDITDFCLRDFGLKRSPRSVKQIIRNIEEADQKTIDTIFAKYGKTPSQQFASEYPEWFIRRRKLLLISYTDALMRNIIDANLIYATTEAECDERRRKQNAAMGVCGNLYRELQYLKRLFPINLNWIAGTITLIKREETLLKGWRRSDNKIRKKITEGKV